MGIWELGGKKELQSMDCDKIIILSGMYTMDIDIFIIESTYLLEQTNQFAYFSFLLSA